MIFQEIAQAIHNSETRADMREPLLKIAEILEEHEDKIKKLEKKEK